MSCLCNSECRRQLHLLPTLAASGISAQIHKMNQAPNLCISTFVDLGLQYSSITILKMKEMMGKNNLVKLTSKPVLSLRFGIYLALGLTKSCTDQAQ